MPEALEKLLMQAIADARNAGELADFEIKDFGIERPADRSHGDYSSTVALRAAKLAHMAPQQLAQIIVNHMPEDSRVAKVEIAGPGFINFTLSVASSASIFQTVREQGKDFGRVDVGHGDTINIEFVSANPVGPMHVGHGRWAALGDSICNVMEFANYDVTREFYINDHGSQIEVFGRSVAKRYMQLAELMQQGKTLDEAYEVVVADRDAFVEDENDEHPDAHPLMDDFSQSLGENSYGGTYIIDLARDFWKTDGDKWVNASEDDRVFEFRERGYKQMVENMRTTCHDVNCDFDVWFSERKLYEKDQTGMSLVDRAFKRLDDMGFLYKKDDALWFATTKFGDDKDRVLIKANGEYTYFSSDVAYHWDKFERGAKTALDIWGSDHHGYIQRVKSSCDAFGYEGRFEVLLGQFVNLLRNGKPVRMSKRKGVMVTFRELIDEVGSDAVRYTLISKSSNQTIDFDIEAVKEKNSSNPVYYVQYAHARICSLLRRAAGVSEQQAAEMGMDAVAQKAIATPVDYALLSSPQELALARKMSEFSDLIAGCARDRAPFRLTHYVHDLASLFHSFYHDCQILPREDQEISAELSSARLAVCDAVRINLEVALKLIGVSAPEVM